SGTGKSSVVKAGAMPRLAAESGWRMLPVIRPATNPSEALSDAVANAGERSLLVIDQFEELATLAAAAERRRFLEALAAVIDERGETIHVVITLRSDFEPQFADSVLARWWKGGRFVIPPMSPIELRDAIELPAAQRVLYFDDPTLVDDLIAE